MRCACLELMRLERISWFSFRFGTVVATRGCHYGIGGQVSKTESRSGLLFLAESCSCVWGPQGIDHVGFLQPTCYPRAGSYGSGSLPKLCHFLLNGPVGGLKNLPSPDLATKPAHSSRPLGTSVFLGYHPVLKF